MGRMMNQIKRLREVVEVSIRPILIGVSALVLSGCVVFADTATMDFSDDDRGITTYRVDGLPDWAPFSSVVRAGETLYVSGHLGRQPGTTDLVDGGVGPQTTQTLANIEASLALAGADLNDVVSCTVYLTDMAGYQAMNTAYAEGFGGHRPARVTAGVEALALGAVVEIDCIAYAPETAK
jgi:2-iminobutanoate/2-iminopropanoate deaminase